MLACGVRESPLGGVKESGIGRVNGELALRGFCHAGSIVVNRFGGKAEATWYPDSRDKFKLLQRMVRLVWGTPVGRFLS